MDLPGPTSKFHRLPYAGLPLELHTEAWPTDDGGLEIAVSWQTEQVTRAFAEGENSRSGVRTKTVVTDIGPVSIDVGRDRD